MGVLKKNALIIAMGFAFGGSALVQADDHKMEVWAGIDRHMFDNRRGVDDRLGKSVGLGYVLNENWTLEGVANDVNTNADFSGANTNVRYYRLDALYNFARNGSWQPFMVGGAGEQGFAVKGNPAGKHKETALNLGFGTKYYLTEDWQLRGDARVIHSLDEEDTDFVVGVGLAYLMGKSSTPKRVDSDGDTVYDDVDQCPNTPAGVAVDAKGCPLDGDRDGVFDYGDQCPNTVPGATVDVNGCAIEVKQVVKEMTDVSIELQVNFDYDKSVVKPEYMSEIKAVADFMGEHPSTDVELAGHTDSRASEAYNLGLSERRASAVARVLVQEFKIDSSRVSSRGYGEVRPVADNDSSEGRAANRRVVADLKAQVEK
jgi:OOP family OmpA-OmpF porin